ncbi:hypothetical protein PIB30_075173 [Stylosanthes scabra]|uniref:Uncharacterized protein n=1 Tax=Stylosanthes scabra TaxID=79078 RepID=A0ABU6WTC0_9FABA|nr:hypothetical protein [Stylosanthes scabra]
MVLTPFPSRFLQELLVTVMRAYASVGVVCEEVLSSGPLAVVHVPKEQFDLVEPGDGLTILHCILCLMREIMLIGYLCDIFCMIVCATQMVANRRNARRVPIDSDPPIDTATFMAAMNSMATAMRDSTAAIRESAAATNRAMEHIGKRNRENENWGYDDERDNGVGGMNSVTPQFSTPCTTPTIEMPHFLI